MAGTIRTIDDKTAFAKVFQDNFAGGDLFLKTSNGNLKVAFLGYTDGQMALKIPFIKSMPPSALVFARRNETTIYAELKTVEKQEADVFIFAPVKVQMIISSRKEDRANVQGEPEGKNLLFVTNVASDFNLYDSVSLEKKKTAMIKDKILGDLSKLFTDVAVCFCAEETGDPRMRFFRENGNRPLNIPSVENKNSASASDMAYYRESIYAKEQFNMKRKGLISEITVPILYRGMIPFGYLQINSTVTLDPSYIQILQRAAHLSEQMMVRGGIIRDICSDRLLVSDISRSGTGIVFKDRKYIRFFKEKATVSYDLILTDGTAVPMASTVKNIGLMENKVIKVGCEIQQVDEAAKSHYDEFLVRHGIGEKKDPKPAQ